jgi:hypothetical protein
MLCNRLLIHTFDYGYKINGINLIENGMEKYRTISPKKFGMDKCGLCWDYVEFEALKMESLGFKGTTNILKNNQYCLYFMQHGSIDNKNPTHTWLAFKFKDKLHSFESSWKTKSMWGIKKFEDEDEMIKFYIKNQERVEKEKYGKSYLDGTVLVMRFEKHNKFNLTPGEYLKDMYKNGKIILNKGVDL